MADLTIAGFITARLAEEQAAAQATAWSMSTQIDNPWQARPPRDDDEGWTVWSKGRFLMFRGLEEADACHIARWDPTRVLAEVAAKRRILARHSAAPGGEELAMPLYCAAHAYKHRDGTVTFPVQLDACPDLRDLASVYRWHPEHRAEWAPVPG